MLLRGDAQYETRDVVMLARIADKSIYIRHHSSERFVRCFGRSILDAWKQPRFAVFFSRIVDGFDDSIRKDEEQVARLKLHASRWVGNDVVGEQRKPERRASGGETLDLTGGAPQNGIVVAGIHVNHLARLRIDFGKERGRESASIKAVGAAITIKADHNLVERRGCRRERAQARLKRGHEQRGGNAFPGDVRDHDEKRWRDRFLRRDRTEEGVVVIARNRILRARGKRDIYARHARGMVGNEPLLNFARDFQVALHRDAIGEFNSEQYE